MHSGITSQFALNRAEIQMSTLDSYRYSNNTTIMCTGAQPALHFGEGVQFSRTFIRWRHRAHSTV